MDSIKHIVGQRIAEERRKRKLSQEKLAELAGLHHNYIGIVERGEQNITIENAYKIAKALKLRLTDLLKGL